MGAVEACQARHVQAVVLGRGAGVFDDRSLGGVLRACFGGSLHRPTYRPKFVALVSNVPCVNERLHCVVVFLLLPFFFVSYSAADDGQHKKDGSRVSNYCDSVLRQ